MKFTTVSDWLDWQTQLHTHEIDLGLDRIRPVFTRLVKSTLATKTVVIGGTNGKGSTVSFFESIYTSGGYRVGSYTSPHLLRYNERVRLQGEPVSDALLCQAFDRVEHAREDTPLTYFEFGTLAAFDIFQRSDLDIVFLEVGLGGRLDAVNLVDADVALITNIELDHMDWLGDTREKIAMEKFGIARSDKPLIYVDADLPKNAGEYCKENHVQLYQLSKDFLFSFSDTVWSWATANKNDSSEVAKDDSKSIDRQYHSLSIPRLVGVHQMKNAAGVLMAVALLENDLPLSMPHLRLGLSSATLPGRFQIIPLGDNLQIFDVAHNPHGIQAFLVNLAKLPKIGDHLLVFGMLQDKSLVDVINLLKPHVDHWFVASINDPRGLSSAELAQSLILQDVPESQISLFDNAKLAHESARQALQSHDKLLSLGSFHVVADGVSH